METTTQTTATPIIETSTMWEDERPKAENLSDRQLAEWNYRQQDAQRKLLMSIKNMMVFFVILTIASLIAGIVAFQIISERIH